MEKFLCRKTIISIGGGELRTKSTLEIDRFIADLANRHANGKRAYALFLGTASHDFRPYFNTFRKTYTSELGLKSDVALTIRGEMSMERVSEKFLLADMIYIGGGDTVFMLEEWKRCGMLELVLDAYKRGVVISGLSAGAICWFDRMYTDSEIAGSSDSYNLHDGLKVLSGLCCPHYNERKEDFDKVVFDGRLTALAIENDCAVVFEDETMKGTISSGGKAYLLKGTEKLIERKEIPVYTD